ncbi:MAG: hypothetical protein IT259_00090 [Saprospiraceae bacterium]|nr:hypothetical protein [Saprospiraceae bacterium]
MNLRPSLFWDVNLATLDLQKHKTQVIERTLMRGMKEEFDELLRYYGWGVVRDTALQARYLDKYTLAFCSAIFNVPKTEFRCYEPAQSNPGHWDY